MSPRGCPGRYPGAAGDVRGMAVTKRGKPKDRETEHQSPAPEEERQAQVGDILTRIPAPARAADQAKPVPGTKWEEAGGGCELVVTNAVLYTKFLSGNPPDGQRRRSRWEP